MDNKQYEIKIKRDNVIQRAVVETSFVEQKNSDWPLSKIAITAESLNISTAEYDFFDAFEALTARLKEMNIVLLCAGADIRFAHSSLSREFSHGLIGYFNGRRGVNIFENVDYVIPRGSGCFTFLISRFVNLILAPFTTKSS